ncbi:enoyl-CoA hydratase/isomerase family protein [Hoeflea sp. WL0058]|uniref:Enoyl-CoA hydratase/isomerase family protein n=2 Tax=Flavimaribacter sediminis TaxID=2865987 RepID=A0AAE2ZMZ8_9HYPH|nr:enoyl-CoA hydratase/isomerase family protein [Flavimaribacter sediminis]
MNAISLEGFGELRAVFEALRRDRDVHAIILTGEGKAFCAGAALDSFVDKHGFKLTPGTLRKAFDEHLNPLMRTMMEIEKPIIIAINGPVAGGGIGLALAGDVVIASETARFHCGFVPMLAIVPDAGTSWLLPNLMGRNRALPMALLGDPLDAQEAMAEGLIYRVVGPDALMEEARGYAERLSRAPVDALRRARMLFTDAAATRFSDMLDKERDANCELVAGPEMKEGVSAFLEKRTPDFKISGSDGGSGS